MKKAEKAPQPAEPTEETEEWDADIPVTSGSVIDVEQEKLQEAEQPKADSWEIETYIPQHLEKFKGWAQDGKGINEQIKNLGPLDVMNWIREQAEHPPSHTWAKRFIEKESIAQIAAKTGRRESSISLAISSAAQRMGYDVRSGKF